MARHDEIPVGNPEICTQLPNFTNERTLRDAIDYLRSIYELRRSKGYAELPALQEALDAAKYVFDPGLPRRPWFAVLRARLASGLRWLADHLD